MSSGHKRLRDSTSTLEVDMTSTSLSSSSLLSSSSSSSSALNTDEPNEPSSSLVAPSTPLGVLSALRSQLEQLERDRESLIAGTLGVYSERCSLFESLRADALARAATQRRHEIEAAQRAFAFAEHAAISTCSTACGELRASMNREINDRELEIRNALARISGGSISSSVHAVSSLSTAMDAASGSGGGGGGGAGTDEPNSSKAAPTMLDEKGSKSHRLLRSKRSKEDGVAAAASGSGGLGGPNSGATNTDGRLLSSFSGNDSKTPGAISISLPPAEALADMRIIYRDWKEIAHRWRAKSASALLQARVELGKLFYDTLTFAKGDSVSVFSELTKQEYVGELFALSQTEVLVKVATGGPKPTGLRIPLVHLRHGRVSMAHYSSPSALAHAPPPPPSSSLISSTALTSPVDEPFSEPRLKMTQSAGANASSKRPASLSTLLAVGSSQVKVSKPTRPPVRRERATAPVTTAVSTASTISSVASDMAIDGAASGITVLTSDGATAAAGDVNLIHIPTGLGNRETHLVQNGNAVGGTVQEALLASTMDTNRSTAEQLEPLDRMNATLGL